VDSGSFACPLYDTGVRVGACSGGYVCGGGGGHWGAIIVLLAKRWSGWGGAGHEICAYHGEDKGGCAKKLSQAM
jgi:hypothetical protein